MQTVELPYRLGCPVWSCDQWGGEVYPLGTKRPQWLRWYSQTFNTVEGNSTFYGVPSPDTAAKWAEQSAPGFRFALKFPREVTHDLRLRDTTAAMRPFLDVLRVLADHDRLGPTFLQLPPDFAPAQFDDLMRFLDELPAQWPWAVEVRHLDWYDADVHEHRLDESLEQRSIDKVLFDSRCLYSGPPDDEIEAVSQTRKPKTPHRKTVTGSRPMVRFVGRNKIELTEPYVNAWANVVADWIREGLEPYFFTHAPDDRFAPPLGRLFHQRLSQTLEAKGGSPLSPIPKPTPPKIQQSLF